MPVNSTQNASMYGFNGDNWDKVHINASGHMKCNVENSLTIASMPTVTTDISGQYVNVANNTDPSTGSKQDAQLTQLSTLAGAVSGTEMQVDIVSGSVSVSNLPADPSTGTKQDTGNASLSALEGSLYADGDTVAVSDVGVLVMGRNGTNAAKPIHITSNGDVEVEIADFVKGQALMSASFPVVLPSDQSTLNVQQFDVVNKGAENNIANNETITAGSQGTGNADVSDMKDSFIIYEDSATSSFDAVEVLVSGNSGSNYHAVAQIYPANNPAGTKRVGYLQLNLGGLTNLAIQNASSVDTYSNVYCMVYGSP